MVGSDMGNSLQCGIDIIAEIAGRRRIPKRYVLETILPIGKSSGFSQMEEFAIRLR
jgi:hypothetical protein